MALGYTLFCKKILRTKYYTKILCFYQGICVLFYMNDNFYCIYHLLYTIIINKMKFINNKNICILSMK